MFLCCLIASPGSADTGEAIKQHKNIQRQNIRVNIEADSLNSVLLRPDVEPGSPEFGFFAREVMREMTAKAGQKCTAIRRILVPQDKAEAAIDAISTALKAVVVGDPAN